MSEPRAVPVVAYTAALACSAGIFALLPLLLVGWEVDQRFSRPIAFGGCAIAAAGFAWLWPAGSWRWGVWLSTALWLFFGGVFAALLANGVPEWRPLVDAASALAAGCVAAALAARLARTARSN